MYKYLPWPPPRPVITRPDDWQLYVVIGSRVVITQAELKQINIRTDYVPHLSFVAL
jgi:hypothetical protein